MDRDLNLPLFRTSSSGGGVQVSVPFRVYWEDTDAGGVVYYANYLKFMERCRTDWLRALGIDQLRLRAERQLQFAVVSVAVDFCAPPYSMMKFSSRRNSSA